VYVYDAAQIQASIDERRDATRARSLREGQRGAACAEEKEKDSDQAR